MYGTLALTPKALDDYRAVSGDAIDEIRALARPLQGLRVLHLSATAFGTGVAELLNGVVPLLNDIGIECSWQVVRPTEESAVANKAIYRALAGASTDWSPELGEVWLRYSAMNAELLTEPFDVIVVHDPQPAAIRSFVAEAARTGSRWIFHSHLDLSSAQPAAWRLLRSHLEGYDAIAFDADSFVHGDLHTQPITIIPPAIDPLGPRNMDLTPDLVETILRRYGIDPARPLISQTSPSDPSCDLLGAIEVHGLLQRRVPGLQLALIVATPPEDADSITYFDDVVRQSNEYPDVHILRGVNEIGNVELNAFQRASDVVIQKKFRRGFAVWISDAQWKERPVVSSHDGSLPLQVIDGATGFLADSTEDFADRVADLLQDSALAARLGAAAHRHVAERFLLPRFLADELRLFTGLAQEGR